MKNRLTTITIAAILFAAVLLSLSCKDTSQNNTTSNTTANNTVANIDQNNSVQNSEPVSALAINCSPANPARRQEVFDEIKANIGKNTDLQKQYISKKFDFDVVDASGKLVVYFWGVVQTKKEDSVDDLNKTFKKLVKKDCVDKVIFGKTSGGSTITSPGFEYNLCEHPNGVCSDGTCRQGCLALVEDNTNKNANTNR